MMIGHVGAHLRRLRHQGGKRLYLGDQSYKVRGYAANRLAVSEQSHELQLLPLLKAIMADRPGTFVDVGVNVGQTLLKVLSIDPNRSYVGFEPQVACCFFVEQFLQDNALHNCKVLPIGLSDSTDILQFFASDGYDEMGSIVAPVANGRHAVPKPISVTTGDIALAELQIKDPAIIKIDVEGAEINVVRGLKKTLRDYQPVIFIEVLPGFIGGRQDQMDDITATAKALWDVLAGLGYSIYNIDKKGLLSQVSKFETHDEAKFISFEYLAMPDTQAPPPHLLTDAPAR